MTASGDSADTARRLPSWRYWLAALALLGAGALLHLWYLIDACPLDLSGDEAHYWEWSRRLDLSYYSKGPLVAYIIALSRWLLAGWSQRTVGSEALAVRVPAILLSVGTGLGIFALARQTLRRPALALAAVAITATVPILTVGAILMTIDAPLALCYVWTLVAVERGLRTGRTWPWVVAGVLIALGILAKYTMLLVFPAVGLALLIEPGYRSSLRRPGPYLATVIGLLGFAPILIWNARHGWVSFRHVAGQAGVSGGTSFDLAGIAAYLGGQAAVISPVWFVALVCALVALWRRPQAEVGERHERAAVRLLLCAAWTPWLVFLLFSPITKVQPNWPVIGLLPGVVLLVLWLSRLLRRSAAAARRPARILIGAAVVCGSAIVVVAHRSEWLMPVFVWLARGSPPLHLTQRAPFWDLTPTARFDTTARLRGWSQLGAAVGRVLEVERSAGRTPFIVTDDYQTASEIAFYCPGQPDVYCLQAVLGKRQSQYDLWPNPIRDAVQFVGRPCLYVGVLKSELVGKVASGHAALRGVRLADTVEHRVRGQPVQIWPVYVCDEYAGLPAELLQRAACKF